MIESAWAALAAQFSSNQFLTGATLTGALAGLVALVRVWLRAAIAWVRGWFQVSLTVHSEDILFLYVSSWLYHHGFDRFSRAYRLRYVDGRAMYGPPRLVPGGNGYWERLNDGEGAIQVCRPVFYFPHGKTAHNFFVGIGADQLLHHAQLVLTAWWCGLL